MQSDHPAGVTDLFPKAGHEEAHHVIPAQSARIDRCGAQRSVDARAPPFGRFGVPRIGCPRRFRIRP
jgi:hypothetical protein